jgi:hypothetical protein
LAILGFCIAGKDGKFEPAKAEWSNPGESSIMPAHVFTGMRGAAIRW